MRSIGKRRSILRRVLFSFVLVVLIGAASPFLARSWMHFTARGRMYTDVADAPECRVALVLGCKVYRSGRPCALLRDRLDTAIDLYKVGKVDKLLMSGDNRFTHYDEPTHMAEYAIKQGVPKEDVVMDFAGRRTYDSVYRAKHIFGQDKLIVVSQDFHLDRALFLCRKLGVDGYGVVADGWDSPQGRVREMPACVSALLDVYILHPKPILGNRETI